MEVDNHNHNTSDSSNSTSSSNNNSNNENKSNNNNFIIDIANAVNEIDHDMLCPICLEKFDNITFLDICFHQFCFVCILQWSEVNFKCPLCKSDFHSLIYDVKSNTDYKRYPLFPSTGGIKKFNNNNRTTTTTTTTNSSFRNNYIGSSQPNIEEGLAFRSSVYAKGIRAIPMVAAFKLFLNPIAINSNFNVWRLKLEPWIKRELRAIIPTTETGSLIILQELIMEILRKHNIKTDPKVKASLERFLFHKTDHFIHELICFACSPYGVAAYDLNVKYNQVSDNGGVDGNQLKPLDQLFKKSKTPIPPSLASILEGASEDTHYLDQNDYYSNDDEDEININNSKRKRLESDISRKGNTFKKMK